GVYRRPAGVREPTQWRDNGKDIALYGAAPLRSVLCVGQRRFLAGEERLESPTETHYALLARSALDQNVVPLACGPSDVGGLLSCSFEGDNRIATEPQLVAPAANGNAHDPPLGAAIRHDQPQPAAVLIEAGRFDPSYSRGVQPVQCARRHRSSPNLCPKWI